LIINFRRLQWRKTSGSSRRSFTASTSKPRAFLYAAQPVNVFLRTDVGEIKGGLIGRILAGWLLIGTLSVDPQYRRRGCGVELMRTAEAEARVGGCKYAWLDTFEFQARPFYEQLGYECFGVLNDHPIGHTHYFMYKRLW
jgi:GNAT superfamily N-acetyltransferase